MERYLLAITGRRFAPGAVRLLEAIWCYTSYPDARIWNNRVAALAGTARSTGNLALSAALALSEADIYGLGPCVRAIDFLIRTRAELEAGGELAACLRRERSRGRALGGYGRPLCAADERIEPTVGLAGSLGLADGPHLKLARAVEALLVVERPRMRMNYGALTAALAADVGLTAREHYHFLIPLFLGGMPPCYLEATERPAGAFLPLPCQGVAYRGAPRRAWGAA
jgi:hypothetical protein